MHARDGNLPHLRDIDLTGAVDDCAEGGFDLAPDFDLQFVAGADHVITRNLHQVDRLKRAWRLLEKRLPKDRQRTPDGICDQLFEWCLRADNRLSPDKL